MLVRDWNRVLPVSPFIMNIFTTLVSHSGKLYFVCFLESGSVCQILKTGIILPFFKGKGAKANNKDNYGGITLFPTISNLLTHLKNSHYKKDIFLKCSLGCKKERDVLKHRSLFWKQVITCLKGGVKYLGVLLTFVKPLILLDWWSISRIIHRTCNWRENVVSNKISLYWG